MSLRNVIESSIAASTSESAMEHRKSQVKELTPTYKRLAAQSIDVVVFLAPSIQLTFDRLAMQRSGYRFIGSGAEARVYSDGEKVIKYVRESERLTSDERIALRDKKAAEFNLLRTYLSAFVLEQSIMVAPHAVKKNVEVVQTVQPHTEFSRLLGRSGYEGDIIFSDTAMTSADELSNFLDVTWQLFGREGILPDTNGTDNIVMTENGVVLLDTQPIGADRGELQSLIKQQLGSIENYLGRIS